MRESGAAAPTAFISYSHDSPEHSDRVIALAERLRRDGVHPVMDRDQASPPEGWVRWVTRSLETADYVLVICTASYHQRFQGVIAGGAGRGVAWEGTILHQLLYEAGAKNHRVIPVLMDAADRPHIPLILRNATAYNMQVPGDYERLRDRLLGAAPASGGPVPPVSQAPRAGSLPRRNRYFTGREILLHRMRALLAPGGMPVALCGLGGVGKSELAAEYAHRFSAQYARIWWVPAHSRSALEASLARLANSLDQESGWLLICDDLRDLRLAAELLPATANGSILITTRVPATGCVAQSLQVGPLRPADGALLLLRRARGLLTESVPEWAVDEEQEAALALAEELGGLPLALEQAGAFVEESRLTIREYLQAYREDGAVLRSTCGLLAEGGAVTVSSVWAEALDRLAAESPVAFDLLQFLAFLAPDAIPEAIVWQYLSDQPPPEPGTTRPHLYGRRVITELCGSSLVDREPRTGTLVVHRLVQAVVRDRMVHADRLRRVRQSASVLGALQTGSETPERSPAVDLLLPHLRQAALWLDQYQPDLPEAGLLGQQLGARYLARLLPGPAASAILQVLDQIARAAPADGRWNLASGG